jgi:peptide/nickel transport system substrate-binding protein
MRMLPKGIAATLASLLLAVSCTPSATTTASASPARSAAAVQPVRGGTLTLVTDDQPATYDAHQETSPAALDLLAPEYSLLYRVDPLDSTKLVPDVAAALPTLSADKLTVTVKVRDDVKFHDGAALTSADVLATYQKIVAAGSARRSWYAMVDSITAPDATTVVFKLKNASAAFTTLLASPWNLIYSAAKLKSDPRYYETNVDGTGPFVFVSNAKGSEWVAKKNAAYFGKDATGAQLPYLDGIRVLVMRDAAARVAALKAKTATLDPRGVTPSERDDLARAIPSDLALQETPASCTEMLIPNVNAKPLDDVRVRQALTQSIDRRGNNTALAQKIDVKDIGGLDRPGSTFALADADLQKVKGFGTDAAAAKDAAKKLLADAGQSALTLKLLTGTATVDQVIGDFVIDQWKQVGVTATRDSRATSRDVVASGQFQVALDTVCTVLDEPDLVLARFRGAFGDSKLDGLIDAQSRETDANKRATAVGDVERYVLDEKAYAFPIIWRLRIVPQLRTLRGWRASSADGNGEDLAAAWIAP